VAIHEKQGQSDEWYTPKYIFEALGVEFDLDVASPLQRTNVPCNNMITSNSLQKQWFGFVWMNPPWCSTIDKMNWVVKFCNHGNGIALMPDSTSTVWWQYFAANCEAILQTNHRIKFIKPDGKTGNNPANGTTLFAIGEKAVSALVNAEKKGLGILFYPNKLTS
jgi:phage N-6-adenine-methyltransferase